MRTFLIFVIIMLTSCTVNFNISQSIGEASDVVDNLPSVDSNVEPDFRLSPL